MTLVHGGEVPDPGVVDQDVEAAALAGDRLDEALLVLFAPRVGRKAPDVESRPSRKRAERGPDRLLGAARDEDREPVGGEPPRDRLADPAGAAGHERDAGRRHGRGILSLRGERAQGCMVPACVDGSAGRDARYSPSAWAAWGSPGRTAIPPWTKPPGSTSSGTRSTSASITSTPPTSTDPSGTSPSWDAPSPADGTASLLATKTGLVVEDASTYRYGRNGRPDHVRASCDASLARLGVDVIDLYYLHRVDPATPVEETWAAMAGLVAAGKVRRLGISEPTVGELDRVSRIHPVTAVQSELSLWTLDPLGDVVPWCAEHGVSFVAFSRSAAVS